MNIYHAYSTCGFLNNCSVMPMGLFISRGSLSNTEEVGLCLASSLG